jgi:hypothetical protein
MIKYMRRRSEKAIQDHRESILKRTVIRGGSLLVIDQARCTKILMRIVSEQPRIITVSGVPELAISIMNRWFDVVHSHSRFPDHLASSYIIDSSSMKSGRLSLKNIPGVHAFVAAACFVLSCKSLLDISTCFIDQKRDGDYFRRISEMYPSLNNFHFLLLSLPMSTIFKRPHEPTTTKRSSRMRLTSSDTESRPSFDSSYLSCLEASLLIDIDWVVTSPNVVDFVHIVTTSIRLFLSKMDHTQNYVSALCTSIKLMCEISIVVHMSAIRLRDPETPSMHSPSWDLAFRFMSDAVHTCVTDDDELREGIIRHVRIVMGREPGRSKEPGLKRHQPFSTFDEL